MSRVEFTPDVERQLCTIAAATGKPDSFVLSAARAVARQEQALGGKTPDELGNRVVEVMRAANRMGGLARRPHPIL